MRKGLHRRAWFRAGLSVLLLSLMTASASAFFDRDYFPRPPTTQTPPPTVTPPTTPPVNPPVDPPPTTGGTSEPIPPPLPPIVPPVVPYCPPVVPQPPTGNPQTPEPATMLSGMIGLAMSGFWLKRRRKASA